MSFWGRARTFADKLDSPLTFVATVIGFGAIYFVIVDWRVQTMLRDPEFVQKVAKQSHPALVFDAEGRVLADMGALDYLADVPQFQLREKDTYTDKIIIQPKAFLRSEPIVQSLDQSNVSVITKRGKGVTWEVTISARFIGLATEFTPSQVAPPRFRLEIVP